MGFRFQRRKKLFGGLGLNFSKTGLSWSFRGKMGSINPKGFRLRTGIKGLQYVQGIKQVPNAKNNSGFLSSKNSKTNDNKNAFIGILAVACIFSIIFLPLLFSPLLIWIIIILIIRKTNSDKTLNFAKKINTANTSDFSGNFHSGESDFYNSSEPGTIEEDTSAENNKITIDFKLENNILDICDNLILACKSSEGKINFSKIDSQIKYPEGYIIYDLCRIFYFLDLSVFSDCTERDMLLCAYCYLRTPQLTIEIIKSDQNVLFQVLEELNGIINSTHPLNLDSEKHPFVIPELLKMDRNKSFYSQYMNQLDTFVRLITTIDLNLKKEETRIIKLIKGYL